MKPQHALETTIPLGPDLQLQGFLASAEHAQGIVVFVHGSGSSRFSVRNNQVAQFLRSQGFATLLMDLLTASEDQVDAITRELRFNIPMLAERVTGTLDWLARQEDVGRLPVGLFGASTGAAAALIAAAALPSRVKAVVSRGGRPDLAGDSLTAVRTPTLLIVGSRDSEVLRLNQVAMRQIPGQTQLVIVAGATHLFEEPGTLDQVSRHAAEFFKLHLNATRPQRAPAPGNKR